MDPYNESELAQVLNPLLLQDLHYYDRIWMKTMLQKARSCRVPGSTLIVGSSYALNDIRESVWKNAVSCSMHSQDLYYDFLCAKQAIGSVSSAYFTRCFIVAGYYLLGNDLSLSVSEREKWVSSVFYPIFHDGHHWDAPVSMDIWAKYADIPERMRPRLEKMAKRKILETGTYYSDVRPRWRPALSNGHTWAEASDAERDAWARDRAELHNRQYYHKASTQENFELLNELVRFLRSYRIEPILVMAPFTEAYNRHILPDMKADLERLLDELPEAFHYVDFNEYSLGIFDDHDFSDPDHMNERGAEKMSRILTEMFGE